jgi:hypothetical protein
MSGELVVAVLSSTVALASVAISVWSARGTARLQSELEERRRQTSKEELVEEVMSRYREPLLRNQLLVAPTPPRTTGGWWRCSTPCWT